MCDWVWWYRDYSAFSYFLLLFRISVGFSPDMAWYISGLIRLIYRSISSSVFILQVVHKFIVLLCNLFGFTACGFYGMKKIIFKNKESTIHQLLEKAKLHFLRWMKVNNINVRLNFCMRWSFVCLGID